MAGSLMVQEDQLPSIISIAELELARDKEAAGG